MLVMIPCTIDITHEDSVALHWEHGMVICARKSSRGFPLNTFFCLTDHKVPTLRMLPQTQQQTGL